MARNIADLVSTARLYTEFLPRCVRHKRSIPDPSSASLPRRIEEIWDIERGFTVGAGAYGVVRIERRRPMLADPSQSTHNQVRAVKEINKHSGIDYRKELHAVVRFSQPRYERFIVQSYGWFENQTSIFITMEYFRLGDLGRFIGLEGPFSENTTGLLIGQILEGVQLMHAIGFAHRDLKPSNILVASRSPWIVKITDFGISKQYDEGTQLDTQVGTRGYMAPEVEGHFPVTHKLKQHSLATDIWAIGVIAMELLQSHPFPYSSDVLDYVKGGESLNFDQIPDVTISPTCQEFVRALLSPDPADRPTASAALAHPWLVEIARSVVPDESLFVQDEMIPSQRLETDMPGATPMRSWSTFGNLRLTDRPQTNRRTQNSTIRSTYQGRPFDASLLIPSFQRLVLEKTKYFVMRSDNPTDMETSMAHGMWTAKKLANKKLDNGYARSSGHVVLFFSLSKSGKFCGVAKMTSRMDWDTTDEDWIPREDGEDYEGRFTLRWLCLNELPFEGVKNVPVSLGKSYRAIACFDATEICPESGYELLRAYSEDHRSSPCFLDLA